MNTEMEFIEKLAKNVERSWTSYSVYLSKMKMKEAIVAIPKWYPDGNVPTDLTEILQDYKAIGTVETHINYGHTYFLDELEKFLKNPNALWNFYDKYKDKKDFSQDPFIKYSTNISQNTEMFFSEMLYNVLQTNEIRVLECGDREKITKHLVNVYKNIISKQYVELYKFQLIASLQNVVEKLERLGSLEDMRVLNNTVAERLGLDFFKISNEIPLVEKGKICGVEFENCSIFQLEAMLCHYCNRLEKVRESIGKGLFFLCYLCGHSDVFKMNVHIVDDEELLECQKEYVVLQNILDEMLKTAHYMFEKSKIDKTDEPKFLDIYNQTVDKYFSAYAEFFQLVEKGKETSEEARQEFEIAFKTYNVTNSHYKHFDYLTKQSLVEDLIIQAERNNINWGVMEDGNDGYKIQWKVLLGFDVPGLNTTLRVHVPIGIFRKTVYDYLHLTEAPLYVGREDFDIADKVSGTQFLLPLTQKQLKSVKLYLAKHKVSTSKVENKQDKSFKNTIDAVRRVKHINYMQLPNTTKRLLSEKTAKTQEFPDYINIFTGTIRRTPRKEV